MALNKTRARKREFGETQPEFESKLLDLARVARVVAGGRRFRFRALVAIGDKKNRIGLGLGKSANVPSAIEKAIHQAKKHLLELPFNTGTIPQEIEVKYKAARLFLKPRKNGLVIGGVLRQMSRLAGIASLTGKMSGSSNKVNNAKAFLKALRILTKNHYAVSRPKINQNQKA